MSTRKLAGVEPRVETGAVQFGDDWPGLFIRGDNCAYYAFALRAHLEGTGGVMEAFTLDGLLADLEGTRVVAAHTPDKEAP